MMMIPPSRDPVVDETWDRLNVLSTLFVRLVWHLSDSNPSIKAAVIADLDSFLATYETKPNPGEQRYVKLLRTSIEGAIDA